MDISLLEDFKALAEYKNFSRAADSRGVTQPAFSRRIRTLEKWVGTELADRRTHRLELTAAGIRFLEVCEDISRRLHLGRQEAIDAASSASSLRFASTHALSLTFFPSWLRRHEAAIASTTVRLIADSMHGCERTMMQGEAHFVLCHHHPAALSRLDSDEFVSCVLGEDVLIPISAPDENGRPRYSLPGSADNPLPYLGFNEESGMGRILAAAWARQPQQIWLKPVFASHLAIVLKQFAREGRGITWSPKSLVETELANGSVALGGGPEWQVPMEIRLFRPRSRQMERVEELWSQASDAAAVSM
ncbi:LysR substrate-binding domain-containing protein [Chelativorans sp. YIM 93263]|uniref:LysR substrate-binding domain-containing protein n=1 Tax=Chelativorans sp. YIM 93263 TaxID=2906648 RepID=UPI0023794507|nr:LysR substrate-binding domain-containing protein [Chelativorans sp. YIM 93263]